MGRRDVLDSFFLFTAGRNAEVCREDSVDDEVGGAIRVAGRPNHHGSGVHCHISSSILQCNSKFEKSLEPHRAAPYVQVENEFGPMESVVGSGAKPYAHWAAQMAVGTNTGVPWVMCKQDDAPDPVVCSVAHYSCTFNGGVAGWRQVPEFLMCSLTVFSSYQLPC